MTEPTTQPVPHDRRKYRIGTSGYSFLDWVGPFYPPGTKRSEMFASYVQAFETVELNFSFYRMPSPKGRHEPRLGLPFSAVCRLV